MRLDQMTNYHSKYSNGRQSSKSRVVSRDPKYHVRMPTPLFGFDCRSVQSKYCIVGDGKKRLGVWDGTTKNAWKRNEEMHRAVSGAPTTTSLCHLR